MNDIVRVDEDQIENIEDFVRSFTIEETDRRYRGHRLTDYHHLLGARETFLTTSMISVNVNMLNAKSFNMKPTFVRLEQKYPGIVWYKVSCGFIVLDERQPAGIFNPSGNSSKNLCKKRLPFLANNDFEKLRFEKDVSPTNFLHLL